MPLSLHTNVHYPSAHFRLKSYRAVENTVSALSSYTYSATFGILIMAGTGLTAHAFYEK